jgi:hypothetical protein
MTVANNNASYIDDDNLEIFALLWLDAAVNSSEENRHAQRNFVLRLIILNHPKMQINVNNIFNSSLHMIDLCLLSAVD